jgi:hypothetical protein
VDNVSVYLPGVILAYATFFAGIASPGPNILAVFGTSMSVGRKSGIALALGVAAGRSETTLVSEQRERLWGARPSSTAATTAATNSAS